jgi:hypothetical protein
VLDRLAALLIEKETIEGEEFESLFAGVLAPRGTGVRAARKAAAPADGEEPVEEEPAATGTRRRRGPAPQPA